MAMPTPPNPPAAALAGPEETPTTAPQETVAEAQAEEVAPAQQETDIVEVVRISCSLEM
jgi:hypothetical protein